VDVLLVVEVELESVVLILDEVVVDEVEVLLLIVVEVD